MKWRGPVWSTLVAVGLLGGCGGGGGNDDPGEGQRTAAPGSAEPGATAAPGTTIASAAPIAGPLLPVSGAGLWAIDPSTGEGRGLTFADVEGVGVQTAPVVSGSSAYVFTYDTVDGQSYSQSVYLSAIDLTTGATRVVATLGVTRETDTSETLTEYDGIAVTGSTVWVRQGVFGTAERQLVGYDATTGTEQRRVEVEGADLLTSDGSQLYFYAGDSLQRLDPSSGAAADVLSRFPSLADLGVGSDLTRLVITRSGEPVPSDGAERLAGLLSLRLGAMVASSGNLWVLANGSASTVEGDLVLAEVVLQLDPLTGAMEAVVPTTEFGDYFTGENEISVGDESIAAAGGAVWVVDRQSNGVVLRIDPSGGSASLAYAPCAADLRCDNGRFNITDADGLWLELTRFGPKNAEGSSSGPISIEQLDPSSGTLVRSVVVSDLITG